MVKRLEHLYGKEVKMHLDYREEGWILTRYAKSYQHNSCGVFSRVRFIVDEERRLMGLQIAAEDKKILSGWVEGLLVSLDEPESIEDKRQVDYIPRAHPYFFLTATGESLFEAPRAYFHTDGKVYI